MTLLPKVRTIGVAIFALLLLVIAPLMASENDQPVRATTPAPSITNDSHEEHSRWLVQEGRQRVADLAAQKAALTVAAHRAKAVADAHAAAAARNAAAAKTLAAKVAALRAEADRLQAQISRTKVRLAEQARARRAATPGPYTVAAVKAYARSLVGDYQFQYLEVLWNGESGWRWTADNPTSDAYGIPQALPGSKMASAGADWATNPYTQVRWGLGYIKDRYGTPEAALAFWNSHSPHWY